MIHSNKVIKKIKEKKFTYGIMNFEFFSSGINKILSNAGLEFVIYDQEHSNISYEQLKTLSLPDEILLITRVPALEYYLIAKSLDAGVKGIMCPKIETKQQAEKLVEYCKYRPNGKRGLAFGIAHDSYDRFSKNDNNNIDFTNIESKMKSLNESILVIPLIETKLGIKNCQEIIGVPGIDMAWLGHYDLTDSMNIVGEFENKKFWDSVEIFINACNKNGKPAGIIDLDIIFLEKLKKKGFTVIGLGHEIALLQDAIFDKLNIIKQE